MTAEPELPSFWGALSMAVHGGKWQMGDTGAGGQPHTVLLGLLTGREPTAGQWRRLSQQCQVRQLGRPLVCSGMGGQEDRRGG